MTRMIRIGSRSGQGSLQLCAPDTWLEQPSRTRPRGSGPIRILYEARTSQGATVQAGEALVQRDADWMEYFLLRFQKAGHNLLHAVKSGENQTHFWLRNKSGTVERRGMLVKNGRSVWLVAASYPCGQKAKGIEWGSILPVLHQSRWEPAEHPGLIEPENEFRIAGWQGKMPATWSTEGVASSGGIRYVNRLPQPSGAPIGDIQIQSLPFPVDWNQRANGWVDQLRRSGFGEMEAVESGLHSPPMHLQVCARVFCRGRREGIATDAECYLLQGANRAVMANIVTPAFSEISEWFAINRFAYRRMLESLRPTV